jgi:hypothetical protein
MFGVAVALGVVAGLDVIPTAELVALCAITATGRIMRKNAATRDRMFRFTLKLRPSMSAVSAGARAS